MKLTLAASLVFLGGVAQSWERDYAYRGQIRGKAAAVALDGTGRVWVAGSSGTDLLVWRYDELTFYRRADAIAAAIAVDGANVYVAANTATGVLLLRLDLDAQFVSETSWPGTASGMAIAGAVYVAGAEGTDAVLWKDGVEIHRRPGSGAAVAAAGNLFLAGSDAGDAFVAEIAPSGALVGVQTYDSGFQDSVGGLAVSDGIYLAGTSSSAIGRDIFVTKLGSWTAVHDTGFDDYGTGLALENGNACVAGYRSDIEMGGWTVEALLVKFDAGGTLAGNWTYGTQAIARGIVADGTELVLVGEAQFNGDCAFVVRYAGGALTPVSEAGYDVVLASAIDAAGNVYVGGVSWNGSDYDAFVIKYGDSGWVYRYDGGIEEGVAGLALDGSGNVVVAAWQDSFGFNSDILLFRVSPAGVLAGPVTVYDGSNSDHPAGIAVDGDDVYIAGSTFDAGFDVLLLKYTAGALVLEKKLDLGGNELGYAMSRSGSSIYVTGEAEGNFLLAKLASDGTTLFTSTQPNGYGAGVLAGDVVYAAATLDGKASLLKFDTDGSLVFTSTFEGAAVAVAIFDGSVWLATGTALVRYSPDGVEQEAKALAGTPFTMTSGSSLVVAGSRGARAWTIAFAETPESIESGGGNRCGLTGIEVLVLGLLYRPRRRRSL